MSMEIFEDKLTLREKVELLVVSIVIILAIYIVSFPILSMILMAKGVRDAYRMLTKS